MNFLVIVMFTLFLLHSISYIFLSFFQSYFTLCVFYFLHLQCTIVFHILFTLIYFLCVFIIYFFLGFRWQRCGHQRHGRHRQVIRIHISIYYNFLIMICHLRCIKNRIKSAVRIMYDNCIRYYKQNLSAPLLISFLSIFLFLTIPSLSLPLSTFSFFARAYFEAQKTQDGEVREVLVDHKWKRTRIPKPRGIRELVGKYVTVQFFIFLTISVEFTGSVLCFCFLLDSIYSSFSLHCSLSPLIFPFIIIYRSIFPFLFIIFPQV